MSELYFNEYIKQRIYTRENKEHLTSPHSVSKKFRFLKFRYFANNGKSPTVPANSMHFGILKKIANANEAAFLGTGLSCENSRFF